MSPKAPNSSDSGAIVTPTATCSTVIAAVPEADHAVAVTVTVPLAADVTNPVSSTVAVAGSPLVHVTLMPDMTCPCWSFTVADSCTVSSSDWSVAEAGETVTVVGVTGSTALSPHAAAKVATRAANRVVVLRCVMGLSVDWRLTDSRGLKASRARCVVG